MISAEHKAELERYHADAAAKIAGIPAQVEAEKIAAADANPPRKPFPVDPLCEVKPAVLASALSQITNATGPIAETVGTWGRVCRTQTADMNVRAVQLLAVLELAGIGKNSPKPE